MAVVTTPWHYARVGERYDFLDEPGQAIWQYPERIVAQDESTARATTGTGPFGTGILIARDFGFNIPSNAAIVGIEVEIVRASSTSSTTDRLVTLALSIDQIGDSRASADIWPNELTPAVYGSLTTDWGSAAIPDEVNYHDFGVHIAADTPDAANLRVDSVRMRVAYEVVDATPPTITSESSSTAPPLQLFDLILTADEPVTWSKVGGLGTVFGSILRYPTGLSAGTYFTIIRANDDAGNYTDQTHVLTVVAPTDPDPDPGTNPGGGSSQQATEWKTPIDMASIPDGTRTWSPLRATILIEADGIFTRATGINSSTISHILRTSSFRFTHSDIPSDATITGVEVEVIRRRSFGSGVPFARHAHLVIDSGDRTSAAISDQISEIRQTEEPWSNSFTTASYGSPTDLWGAALTPEIVKSSAFGFDYGLQGGAASMDAQVDQIRMRIHYSTGGGGSEQPAGRRLVHWH